MLANVSFTYLVKPTSVPGLSVTFSFCWVANQKDKEYPGNVVAKKKNICSVTISLLK